MNGHDPSQGSHGQLKGRDGLRQQQQGWKLPTASAGYRPSPSSPATPAGAHRGACHAQMPLYRLASSPLIRLTTYRKMTIIR
jgi:hypothetical protein